MAYAVPTSDTEVPRITTAVKWLIAINVVIYFLQVTSPISAETMQHALGVQLGDFPSHWWKAVTYMFVHDGFWHVAGNMYMLWLFGTRVEHAWGRPWGFVRYYIICGLAAVAAQILFFRDGYLVGASGAVYGVMVAYAMHWPNDELYFFGVVPIRVKWLVAGYIGYDLFMGARMVPGVAHWAHVGGAAAGFAYFYLQRTPPAEGLDRLRQRIQQSPELPEDTPRPIPRSLPRPREQRNEIDEVVARSKAVAAERRPGPVPVVRKPAPPRATDVDLVLDKISQQGIESLTPDERRLLEEHSKRLRGR